MKYISMIIILLTTGCVPMGTDTGLDSGYKTSADMPGCKTTTYCYEATWLTEANCASGFDYLENGCPTSNMIGECAVNSGGDYQGSATGYYYDGQTDPEGACWDYGNGGTYTAY